MRRIALFSAVGLLLVTAGCQSTQDKSSELAKNAKSVAQEKGLTVTRQNPDVRVVRATALSDQNGAAAVVELRNASRKTLINVPIAIDVKDATGASVFKNDTPGLQPTLVGQPVLLPGQDVAWVNDQVQASGDVKSVTATVGVSNQPPPAKLPSLTITRPTLLDDPASGVYAQGDVTNRSGVEQRKLIVFGVATRGGRVVAAGRSGIDKLKPGKHAQYRIYFIGNPKGREVRRERPPHRPQVRG